MIRWGIRDLAAPHRLIGRIRQPFGRRAAPMPN